ncbi:MAG: hypothetical protein LBB88_11135 [Planctomycetaceae bacterium]|jgi:hypothetical protein|nr:hypothetical protein [Planctomycetaceae bacterium]
MSSKNANITPTRLSRPHLILCEGRDAERFIGTLLDFFQRENNEFCNFQIINFGGIEELNSYLQILPNWSGFRNVKSVTVIRDAERDAQAAVWSVKNAFSRNGFAVPQAAALPMRNVTYSSTCIPVDTGFILFPSCGEKVENGTLEDLCLSILTGEDVESILAAVDNALKDRQFRQLHKNRLHSYFSMTDKYVSLKIGEAAKAQAFNFNAAQMKSCKNFLLEMINEK